MRDQASVWLEAGSALEFIDSTGEVRRHALGAVSGWFHFFIRVHADLGCQTDCVISQTEQLDPDAFVAGNASGIMFQPFFLPGADISNSVLASRGCSPGDCTSAEWSPMATCCFPARASVARVLS
ncbi:hypothetical protein ACCQ05_19845 [Xanthomonas sp. NCPPB 3582]|uniref:hypothetical protein n=1 Tax=Xanthomonas sp. NCPPB 3582 TaxID=487557 RepID=UPI003555C04B